MSVFAPGHLTIIYGDRDSGKSNFEMIMLQHASKRLGKNVMANTPCDNPDIRLISTDIEIFNFFLEYREKIVLSLDEMGIVQSAKRSGSQEALNLEALGAIFRKFDMAEHMIIQRSKNLIPFLRELCYCEIYKPDKSTAIITIGNNVKKVVNITKCQDYGIDYNTKDFAGLKFYLDIPALINDISSMKYEQSVKKLNDIASTGYDAYLLKNRKKQTKIKKKTI